jgi:serine/threonine protein kinase/formylglycine-generating enzyme required for sulfatase activity
MPESFEFEHYQLLKNPDGSFTELGRGAMGITYKAFDTSLRCNVALKVIGASLLEDETVAERFLREARSAAQLRHRNVASVFHLGKHGNRYFYAMEFIDGETVDALVKRNGPLDCLFALDIAQQVASALIAAEKQHLVHRDIKPSNLMLVREGDGEILVKVIDFGLARSVVMQSTAAGDITSGGFVGTPYFASPEQLDRQTEDIRSDIYSLGVTLWYMLIGKPTFIGSVASVIAQHLDKTPPFEALAILPAEVVAVLRKMLEKDRDKRIQTPAELRTELKSCVERLRSLQTSAKPPSGTDWNFDTIALSNPNSAALRPEAGWQLRERYRLIEDINPANPDRTFHAEDMVSRTRVMVRIFHVEPEVLAQITAEAARIQSAAHPNFLKVSVVEREKNFSFAVLEWLEGFPLVDLLRARRALTLRETRMLLKQIAPAVDRARAAKLTLEMNLRDIFVHFPEGFAEPAADVVLHCPLDEWPAFVVKLDALGKAKELEASATWIGERPPVGDQTHHDVIQLGIVTYELLGGTAGGFTPLSNLSEEGNRILRQCLTPGRSYPTGRDFYNALTSLSDVTPTPADTIGQPLPATPSGLASVLSPSARSAPAVERAPPPSRPVKNHTLPIILGLITLLAVGGLLWIFFATSPIPTPLSVAVTPQPTSAKIAVARSPFQPGKSWTNTLEMRFVPLGSIHIAVWQTRLRDFNTFVEATGYDAVGGMSSAIIANGFKLNAMSWKNPGFVQTPEHPVVGVSWEDANQFCAWLTRKERGEGALTAFQSYRLPTDLEWSESVGLLHESGTTPEDRSGKIKGVYPWGNSFPPPVDSGNYAGTESRADAPESWAVIPGFHDAFPRTAPVSAFRPNSHGLCCLGSNVWEWCQDKYNRTMNWRTLRGGSWATSHAEETLSSYRRGYDPLFRSDEVGFRCVIASDGGQE